MNKLNTTIVFILIFCSISVSSERTQDDEYRNDWQVNREDTSQTEEHTRRRALKTRQTNYQDRQSSSGSHYSRRRTPFHEDSLPGRSQSYRTREGWRELTGPKAAARITPHYSYENRGSHPNYQQHSRQQAKPFEQTYPYRNHYPSSRTGTLNNPVHNPSTYTDNRLPDPLTSQRNHRYRNSRHGQSSRARNQNWRSKTWTTNSFNAPFGSESESLPSPEELKADGDRWSPLFSPKIKTDQRPNIVLIMTDDQDVELGSLNYMPKLMQYLGEEGALFSNAYTSTPMCCPSRSSMLTGMYIHNHEVYTNNDNCSSPTWQATHEKKTFATYLNDAGYRTGYFGKYLNKYNGSHVPSGWRDWAGLIMNSRYYNYTVNRNNRKMKYGHRYPQDYFPHVITNDGLQFLRTSASMNPPPPVMMTLSYPGPHGPEDSAPEHSHKFFNASDHHTPSYNYAPNPDKQWMLQFTDRMQDIHLKFTDLLMTKRLQTLQTIDEAVEKLIKELKTLNMLDNTYIFYTSDHGYHLGQFGLVKGKSFPFEFDIKVPFLVRGPGVKPGARMKEIALNIDLAPTFLDIAGIPRPKQMDGRSILPVLKKSQNAARGFDEPVKWRDSFIVESSGRHRLESLLELKEQKRWRREQELSNEGGKKSNKKAESTSLSGLYTSKHERLEEVCKKKQFQPPCDPTQKWQCIRDGRRWRMQKCRSKGSKRRKNCVCEPDLGVGYLIKLNSNERKKQRSFLKKHARKDFRTIDSKFIKTPGNSANDIINNRDQSQRERRIMSRWNNRNLASSRSKRSIEGDGEKQPFSENLNDFVEEEEIKDIDEHIYELKDELEELETLTGADSSINFADYNTSSIFDEPFINCNEDNSSMTCNNEKDFDQHSWKMQKSAIIQLLRKQLAFMKNIRKHVVKATPQHNTPEGEEPFFNYDLESDDEDLTSSGDGLLDFTNLDIEELDNFDDFSIARNIPIQKINPYNTNGSNLGSNLHNHYVRSNFTGVSESIDEFEIEEVYEDIDMTTVDPNSVDQESSKYVHRKAYDLDKSILGYTHNKEMKEARRKYKKTKKLNRSDRQGKSHRKSKYSMPRKSTSISRNSKINLYEDLFPINLSSLSEKEDQKTDEETTLRPICWCNRRTAARITLQAERIKKRLERQKIKEERLKRRVEKRKRKAHHEVMSECNFTKLNCYTHDNDHWKTPPLWTDGKFCFCMNSANNTYWCLRTINETDNFLFCEFITGLITYYDLNIDPYQLRNVAFTLSNDQLTELHRRLQVLRVCSGADNCDEWEDENSPNITTSTAMENIEDESISSDLRIPTSQSRKKDDKWKLRERKRKLRKEQKKQRKYEKDIFDAAVDDLLEYSSQRKQKVRLPRKSRLSKEERRRKRNRGKDRRKKSHRQHKRRKHTQLEQLNN